MTLQILLALCLIHTFAGSDCNSPSVPIDPDQLKEYIIVPKEIKSCEHTNEFYPVKFEVETKMIGKGRVAISATINHSQIVQSISKVLITVYRCRSPSEPESCEYTLYFDVAQVCRKLNQKGQFWSSFVESMVPKYTCPYRKGTYQLANYIIESEKVLSTFSWIKDNYWQITIDSYSKRRHVLCVFIGASVIRMRKNYTSTPRKLINP